MNLSEINWDFNAAGAWPLQIKVAAIFLACCLIIGGGVYQFTLDQLTQLDGLEAKEVGLKKTFKEKQGKAVNLPAYQEQLEQIQKLLDKMIKQMPTKAEVASLLIEMSQIASESGLENRLFQPEATVNKEFYLELPYKIEMLGKYEDLGLFVSGLASLPRIVTVHNVEIQRQGSKDEETPILKMTAVVKTYNEAGNEEDEEDEEVKVKGKVK